MPELPDLTIYQERLAILLVGERLEAIRFGNPFVLRTVTPPVSDLVGRGVEEISRLGKRLIFGLEQERYIVCHLMIAGRFSWKRPGQAIPKGRGLAAFDFAPGTLILTEAGKKRRASLHLVTGRSELRAFDRGGLEVIESDQNGFAAALYAKNHTLKRALTDPSVLAGIGNAYSDEILHRARLSPFKQTQSLDDAEMERLYHATHSILAEWTDRLRAATGDGFPEKVTAFRDGMAVHGRFGKPCPVCAAPVQRIVYAQNQANYCPGCQTKGKLLMDRALSRLLKASWPKTLDELETHS
jgi:formamidopyrimidine-DNA glycosylase